MNKKPLLKEEEKEKKHCYKFAVSVQMGNDIFKRGDCIKLSDSELPEYAPYIEVCKGDKAVSKPCNC